MLAAHTPYAKIAEATNHWDTSGNVAFRPVRKGCRPAEENRWFATEKVHGANFAFLCDGQEVKCAKREQILSDSEEENEGFFKYLTVKRRYEQNVLQLFGLVAARFAAVGRAAVKLTLYGELFGGCYPHPSVAVDPSAPEGGVQSGVYYCPQLEFVAYDLLTSFTVIDDEPVEHHEFSQFSQLLRDLESVKILAPPIIRESDYRGVTEDGLEDFPSKVAHELFHLPPLPGGRGARAEGVVCKTDTCQQVRTKSGVERCIFKRKITSFETVMRTTGAEVRLQDESQAVSAAIRYIKSSLLNVNLLSSAVSKAGKGKNNVESVISFCVRDVTDALRDRDGHPFAVLFDPKPSRGKEELRTVPAAAIVAEVRQYVTDTL